MGIITISNIRLYAHHGCLQEEAIIGSDYRVDLEVEAKLEKASVTDDLDDTVDYVHLNYIVKDEMKQRAKLLEHVGQRIIDRIFSEIGQVDKVIVKVAKLNPPIGGDVESVAVTLKKDRV
ncbi:dihydroneopterin aldolase [Zeaxanthinibacter sp. PT1]|uniref:dihydroneopterin aldolase n=1 Tax=Zeaxanthinibacter TaxID=561554 RepID=UPI00234A171B|nr:dihydroneopterin aldolase [Zeaxanthinibacter sp. PT1]MDC6350651.1 dihydroneopterin aldolase [Zeaxanthinibacter sp. PT1]